MTERTEAAEAVVSVLRNELSNARYAHESAKARLHNANIELEAAQQQHDAVQAKIEEFLKTLELVGATEHPEEPEEPTDTETPEPTDSGN